MYITNIYAQELVIIPLKKPILDKITEQKKITQGIIRPKSKPKLKVEKKELSKEIIQPKSKPSKIDEGKETKIATKEKEEIKEKTIEIIEEKQN